MPAPPNLAAPSLSKEPTVEEWAATLLAHLQVPITTANVKAIVGWANAEGGHWNNSAKYNPLNTTQPAPGAGNTGAQGNIKVYTSWAQGIEATVQTLRNGKYNPILAALKSGNDPNAVASAIGGSPWGTSAASVAQAISGAKIKGSGAVGSNIGPVEAAKSAAEGAFEAGKSVGEVAAHIENWISEPLTPVKFLGGALILFIGIRTLTDTGAGRSLTRETARAASHAAAPARVARRAAKISRPKAG